MKRAIRFSCTLGTALLLSAAAGSLTSIGAQPNTCYKCTLYGQSYSCIPAQDGLGHRTCVVMGQGCLNGPVCGYYLRRGDGTFEGSETPPARRVSNSEKRPRGSAEWVLTGSEPRKVERGCNGMIVRRQYSEAATRRLNQVTRVIRI